MKSNDKLLCIIMDGWAHGTDPKASAISAANTPFIDSLYKEFPNSELITHGELVGLPNGQMGNSEVGHMNMGAGRIVNQDLLKINHIIQNNQLYQNNVLQQAMTFARKHQKPLHFIGLVSDGGIHSHINHLKAMCSMAKDYELQDVFIHALTDGRDTDPKSGLGYLSDLENHLEHTTGEIASVMGRYYGMDRDKRWDRIKKAYDCLVSGIGETTQYISDAIKKSYDNNITDEFIKPVIKVDGDGEPIAVLHPEDVVICFNFRADRFREVTKVLTQTDMEDYNMKKMDLHYFTMSNYDETFENIHVIIENKNVEMTLGELMSHHGKKQIRIAETEKYAHVTYFFSGGRETPFENESRILIPSQKVATYDLCPEMSALQIKDRIIGILDKKEADFICLNFANTDMVGHTGVFNAAIKAVETVDACVDKVITTALDNDYTILLTSDHGNCDFIINADGSPNTAHTKNPAPFFIIDKSYKGKLKDGKLADIAPTALALMGMHVPPQMTGSVLI